MGGPNLGGGSKFARTPGHIGGRGVLAPLGHPCTPDEKMRKEEDEKN